MAAHKLIPDTGSFRPARGFFEKGREKAGSLAAHKESGPALGRP